MSIVIDTSKICMFQAGKPENSEENPNIQVATQKVKCLEGTDQSKAQYGQVNGAEGL